MTREHLDAVGELEQAVQRVEQPFGALRGTHGEVGPGGIADEERVARQHEPRLIAARACRSPSGSNAPAGGRACGSRQA